MANQQSSAPETLQSTLYTYWHKLPFQKVVDASTYYNITGTEVKNFIIKYIRDGIEDEFGETHGLQRRHAFSAKELKAAYDATSNAQKYSISNFHFHIKNLVEEGFLQEVGKLLERRHYVTYYGRTAMSFIPQMDDTLTADLYQNIYGPLRTIIQMRNPQLNPEYVNQLVADNLSIAEDFYARLFRWQQDMYSTIYASKLNLEAFTQYAANYAMIHQDFAKNLSKISELIGLSEHLNSTNIGE